MFTYCQWIFVIANVGNKKKQLEGTKVLHSLLADFRYSWIQHSGLNCRIILSLTLNRSGTNMKTEEVALMTAKLKSYH